LDAAPKKSGAEGGLVTKRTRASRRQSRLPPDPDRVRHIGILRILQENNQVPLHEIGQRIGGLSEPQVSRIVKRLRDRGYIKSEIAVLDALRFRLTTLAFIRFALKDTSGPAVAKSVEHMRSFANVQEIHHIASDEGFDVLVKVRGAGPDEIFKFIGAMEDEGNIEDTETSIVLSTVEENCRLPLKDEDGRFLDVGQE
jgi:DNA-binding Lrp family transcriptional regulator